MHPPETDAGGHTSIARARPPWVSRLSARGELNEDLDIELFIDLVFGAFWHRLLSGRAPVTERFAEQVVEMMWPAIVAKGRG